MDLAGNKTAGFRGPNLVLRSDPNSANPSFDTSRGTGQVARLNSSRIGHFRFLLFGILRSDYGRIRGGGRADLPSMLPSRWKPDLDTARMTVPFDLQFQVLVGRQ